MLPQLVEELTAQWLESALSERFPGIKVKTATVTRVIWGTATKLFMDVDYHKQPFTPLSTETPPSAICIKGEFDERVRRVLAGTSISQTEMEAHFYADIAPQLKIPLVRHWYAGMEPGMGIIILDQLDSASTTFGSPAVPWEPGAVASALDYLALLHASTWNKSFFGTPWLRTGSELLRGGWRVLFSEPNWTRHFSTLGVFQLPETLKSRERNVEAYLALWKYIDANTTCLVHGDAHVGNTYIDAHGQPVFLDWASANISCWAQDVAYFIAGAMTVADRRSNERELLQQYLVKIASYGAPAISMDDAWDEYRRNLLAGLIWNTLPPVIQPGEFVNIMSERYSTAIVDHDSLGALGQ